TIKTIVSFGCAWRIGGRGCCGPNGTTPPEWKLCKKSDSSVRFLPSAGALRSDFIFQATLTAAAAYRHSFHSSARFTFDSGARQRLPLGSDLKKRGRAFFAVCREAASR